MQKIERVISLESLRSRNSDTSYGNITATTVEVKVLLSQSADDMGMPTDMPVFNTPVDYTALVEKYVELGLNPTFVGGTSPTIVLSDDTSIRVVGKPVMDYYAQGGLVTGTTDSKLRVVKSFKKNNPWQIGLSMISEDYENYKYGTVNGESKITDNGNPMKYVIDKDDAKADTGIRYEADMNNTNTVNGVREPITKFEFNSEGWNNLNSSLSAITKEEYLLGIISPPEVQSDVFIDRGATTVMESHLRLSEIESLEHLIDYGNGFYNINKI